MLVFRLVAIIYFTAMAGYYNVFKKDLLRFLWYAFLTLTLEIATTF